MTMTDIGATVGVSTGELKSDQDFYENIENLIQDASRSHDEERSSGSLELRFSLQTTKSDSGGFKIR